MRTIIIVTGYIHLCHFHLGNLTPTAFLALRYFEGYGNDAGTWCLGDTDIIT